MCSVEKSLQTKDTIDLSQPNKPSSLEGSSPSRKPSQQLKWLLLLWAGSVGALTIIAGILWLLMHSAGMTG